MTAPDFAKMTTDDLLEIIPQTETAEWEFKSAKLFGKSQFADFKKNKLGKVVSSFANSGGGYLLLGKQDGQPVFEAVPTHEGRLAMEDHLSLVISQSVSPHYREFRIHRMPISGTVGESILVVEFADSPAAPHQSVADTNYFYRLPGHCQPAPHFHLDLLRNRYTKAVLKIVSVENQLQIPSTQGSPWQLTFAMRVTVENVSLQCATTWGVHVKHKDGEREWAAARVGNFAEGACVHGERATILPSERVPLVIHLVGTTPNTTRTGLLDLYDHMRLVLRPISQNHVGEEWVFGVTEGEMSARIARQGIAKELDNYRIYP